MAKVSATGQNQWVRSVEEQLNKDPRVVGFTKQEQNNFELIWKQAGGGTSSTVVTLDSDKRVIKYRNASYHTIEKVEELMPSILEHLG